MTTTIESKRSWLVVLAVGVSLAAVGGAWAQGGTMTKDPMKQEEMKDGMARDGMARDGMKKDGAMTGADKAMMKDGMKQDDAMKKGEMKGDATMDRKP